jgi:hypothetical protein
MTGFAALLSLIFSNSRISPGKTSIMERFMSQLDKTDRRILTILQMDGRMACRPLKRDGCCKEHDELDFPVTRALRSV